jgi:hypothetical protein
LGRRAEVLDWRRMSVPKQWRIRLLQGILGLWIAVWFNPTMFGAATNYIVWQPQPEQFTADVREATLVGVLEEVARQTGWQVFVEPDESFRASVKYSDLPVGTALRRLLGELNFAFLPATNNGPQRLFVFRTTMNQATQQLRAGGVRPAPQAKRISNELTVRVKPGTDVEALARSVGAKIVGHIPELNAYQFQFEDEAAAEAAREKLLAHADVLGVENIYSVDPPFTPQSLPGRVAADASLKLDPPKSDDCRVVIALVDTTLQALSAQLEPFVKERVSLAGPVNANAMQPTHATAMANAVFQSIQASGQNSTSVRLLSVDVFGAGGAANTFNVAAGLIVAGNKGATIINASLGGYGDSPLLRDAVAQLAQHNIPVFAAVGNDASAVPFYPAAYQDVISVTSVDRSGKIAPYANTGTNPDVAAPGAVIFSHQGLTYGSQGTSVASAAAAGLAAGLSDGSCAPWAQILAALQKSLAVPAVR